MLFHIYQPTRRHIPEDSWAYTDRQYIEEKLAPTNQTEGVTKKKTTIWMEQDHCQENS
jgi:hypothetical protein